MIFGIGCDTVSLARFAAKLGADPHLSPLAKRLFTEAELAAQMTVRSLAARFAAKEALIKALGGSTITAKVAEISEIAAASDRETFCET
ncbi:MAG: 4'-phosphopantetheinyl transferase superfamily protein, partial [Microbacteriaceae bacterium]|nr:4'-phosphopantetheinyl transferase superfamily protein [Microbacteriaceae bacterium]